MPSSNIQLSVVVVGGGITGLSTAIGLRRRGHSVVVAERHDDCQTIGGPIGLAPSATVDSGRVVPAGDAVHAMLPHSGQGAGSSIEDSACLAECLSRVKSHADIPKAVAAYEAIHKPRTNWMSDRARQLTMEQSHLEDGPDQVRRDAIMGMMGPPAGELQQEETAAGPSPARAPGEPAWDGSNFAGPPCRPDDMAHPLARCYNQGYRVLEHTREYLDQHGTAE